MVAKLNFKGFICPSFTPFCRKTGNVNMNMVDLKAYAKYYMDSGIHGVLVNGTVGEGICMNVQERKMVLETWMKTAKDTPLHMMVQVGGGALRDVQELARHAEAQGVSSLLCLPELYHRAARVEDLVRYLSLVSQAAPNTPLIYYHTPKKTAVQFNMAELLEAAAADPGVPTLAGVKFGDNNMEDATRCLTVCEGRYSVMMANSHLIFCAFCAGFDTLNATMLTMLGPLVTEMQTAVIDGKLTEARAKQRQLTAAVDTIMRHGNWVPALKVAMQILTGFDFGIAREPQGTLTAEQIDHLKADLVALNLVK